MAWSRRRKRTVITLLGGGIAMLAGAALLGGGSIRACPAIGYADISRRGKRGGRHGKAAGQRAVDRASDRSARGRAPVPDDDASDEIRRGYLVIRTVIGHVSD